MSINHSPNIWTVYCHIITVHLLFSLSSWFLLKVTFWFNLLSVFPWRWWSCYWRQSSPSLSFYLALPQLLSTDPSLTFGLYRRNSLPATTRFPSTLACLCRCQEMAEDLRLWKRLLRDIRLSFSSTVIEFLCLASFEEGDRLMILVNCGSSFTRLTKRCVSSFLIYVIFSFSLLIIWI